MKRHFHYGPNKNLAWRSAHPQFFRSKEPTLRKDEFRLLHASTEFWSASALWKKSSGAWSCVSADSHLSWMIGKTHEQAHLELLRLGADYSWQKTSNPKHIPTGTSTVIESRGRAQAKATTVRTTCPSVVANGIARQLMPAAKLPAGDWYV